MNISTRRTSILVLALLIVVCGMAFGQVRRNDDPFGNFLFKVEVEGIPEGPVLEISGFSMESEVLKYRPSAESRTRKSAGRTSYSNIIMRRAFTGELSWWQWRDGLVDGSMARKNGSIIILNQRLEEVMRWNFFEAWPVAYRLSPLNTDRSDNLTEEIEIAVEWIELG